ncbi:MAG: hypothetical protein ACK55Z_11630, partial [bacterium]
AKTSGRPPSRRAWRRRRAARRRHRRQRPRATARAPRAGRPAPRIVAAGGRVARPWSPGRKGPHGGRAAAAERQYATPACRRGSDGPSSPRVGSRPSSTSARSS